MGADWGMVSSWDGLSLWAFSFPWDWLPDWFSLSSVVFGAEFWSADWLVPSFSVFPEELLPLSLPLSLSLSLPLSLPFPASLPVLGLVCFSESDFCGSVLFFSSDATELCCWFSPSLDWFCLVSLADGVCCAGSFFFSSCPEFSRSSLTPRPLYLSMSSALTVGFSAAGTCYYHIKRSQKSTYQLVCAPTSFYTGFIP